MIKRLWLLLASAWAAVFLGNALTKANGVGALDVAIAVAPLVAGVVFVYALRYVVFGRVR